MGRSQSKKAADNPWSRGNALARPTWLRQSRQTAAGPSWRSCIFEWQCCSACRSSEDKQDLVALDQPARLLDRFGRTISVVIRDEADLATVDAALSVHLVEISGDRFPDHPVGRRRTAVGIDIADLDLGVACAGIVFLLGKRG